MIFGQLKNLDQEKLALAPVLQRALQYLQSTNLDELALGRHDIDGDNMFALVSEYEVEPKENKLPEAHVRYIDIQYLAWGEELIGCSFLTAQCVIAKDELATRDLIFYTTVADEVNVVITPGNYAIFFPHDIHRPGCINISKQTVKKIVIKIAVSSLM